jgi:DNA-binding CsgD family transcriptional regulator
MIAVAESRSRTCQDCGAAFAGRYARWCPLCRPLHRASKVTKYRLDGQAIALLRERYDGKIPGRAAEIAAALGWPVFAVRRRASLLGLSRPWPADRRAWTAEEVEDLLRYEGVRSANWIARKLGRSHSSVVLKMKHLRLSRRVREGYTARSLAECLGIEAHAVARLIRTGKLRASRQGTERDCDTYQISEKAVLEFVQTHRLEYRLDQVDQTWFLGLVFGPGEPEKSDQVNEDTAMMVFFGRLAAWLKGQRRKTRRNTPPPCPRCGGRRFANLVIQCTCGCKEIALRTGPCWCCGGAGVLPAYLLPRDPHDLSASESRALWEYRHAAN